MKHIKSFKLFESITVYPDKVCALYEDVRSIGYLLEDEGFPVEYRLRVVCIPDGSLQKEIRVITVRNCQDIRGFLNRRNLSLRDFVIKVENPTILSYGQGNFKIDREQEEKFREEFERYYEILREHLDYVDSKFIGKKAMRPPLTFEVSVAAPFFM
jgi:hypothetical protein